MRGERNWGYTSLIDFVIEQMLLKPKSSKIHSPLLQVFEAMLNKREKNLLFAHGTGYLLENKNN